MSILSLLSCLNLAEPPTSVGGEGPGRSGEDDPGPAELEGLDLAALEEDLVADLEKIAVTRTSSVLTSTARRVFWLEGSYDTLHSIDAATDVVVDHTFAMGETPYDPAYEINEELVVIAMANQHRLVAYNPDSEETELGSLDYPSMSSGYYPAFALDGDEVLYVDEVGDRTLFRWRPSTGSATIELLLGDVGIGDGGCDAVGIWGEEVFFAVDGEMWRWDGSAAEVVFEMPSSGRIALAADAGGLLVTSAGSLLFFRFSDGELVDLQAAIKAADYLLTDGHSQAHHYDFGAMKAGDQLYYDAYDGIFRLDLVTGSFDPLLLDPYGGGYDYPVMQGGMLYVSGWSGNDSFVGRVPLHDGN